jgi:hypothetical protein
MSNNPVSTNNGRNVSGRKADKDQTEDDKKNYAEQDARTQKGEGLMSAVAAGTTLTSTEQIALAAYQASVNAATNAAMAAIAQQAAIAAAALKLSNDLNDATVSFTKNVGSSVKSAAQ